MSFLLFLVFTPNRIVPKSSSARKVSITLIQRHSDSAEPRTNTPNTIGDNDDLLHQVRMVEFTNNAVLWRENHGLC